MGERTKERGWTLGARGIGPITWFVLAFVLLCCAYETGRVLHLRPQPHHLWRQADCISLAWNYYDTTGNLFKPAVHEQFADGHASGKSAGEFPLLYYIVGMLWRITGPSEFLYRLLVLLVHFAGTLALFASARRIIGSAFWAGCVALLFYASPVLVYFGTGFLTDVPALDLALIGWWYVVRYVERGRRRSWGWAVLFFTLAMLLKVTAGMSLVALCGVLLWSTVQRGRTNGRWSPFRGDRFEWGAVGLGLLAVLAWYVYAAWYNGVHGAKYTFNGLWPIWTMTAEERAHAWDVGRDLVVFQVFDTSVWVLLGIALVTTAVNVRRIPRPVLLLIGALLIGSVLYVLCWFHALNNHDYYFIGPMITLAVLLVTFLWWLSRHHPVILRSWWTRGAMAGLLLYNVAYTAQNLQMRYDTSGTMSERTLWPIYHATELAYWNELSYWGMTDLPTIEPRLRELGVRRTDKVVFLDDGSINASLVLMGNRGWTSFGIDVRTPGVLDDLIRHGARFLMFTDPKWLSEPRLAAYLTRPAGQVGIVRIYRLSDAP